MAEVEDWVAWQKTSLPDSARERGRRETVNNISIITT